MVDGTVKCFSVGKGRGFVAPDGGPVVVPS
jgi:cold shock CspA family protein